MACKTAAKSCPCHFTNVYCLCTILLRLHYLLLFYLDLKWPRRDSQRHGFHKWPEIAIFKILTCIHRWEWPSRNLAAMSGVRVTAVKKVSAVFFLDISTQCMGTMDRSTGGWMDRVAVGYIALAYSALRNAITNAMQKNSRCAVKYTVLLTESENNNAQTSYSTQPMLCNI